MASETKASPEKEPTFLLQSNPLRIYNLGHKISFILGPQWCQKFDSRIMHKKSDQKAYLCFKVTIDQSQISYIRL